jgi:hypothetical protein
MLLPGGTILQHFFCHVGRHSWALAAYGVLTWQNQPSNGPFTSILLLRERERETKSSFLQDMVSSAILTEPDCFFLVKKEKKKKRKKKQLWLVVVVGTIHTTLPITGSLAH